MDFNAGGNKDYVRYMADNGADVILFQEAKDFRVSDVIPSGWTDYQVTSSEAKAGSAIAVGPGWTLGESWQVLGCGEPAGGGMLPRWITCAEVIGGDPLTAISAHAPPPRYAELQPSFNAALSGVVGATVAPVVGADANMDKDAFARALGHGMVAVGKQSGICLVTALPMADVDTDDWAEEYGQSDHPCVWATVGEA